MYLKILDEIKSIFKNYSKVETEKIIITQKTCPHCVGTGMFIVNRTSITKTQNGDSNEKHK